MAKPQSLLFNSLRQNPKPHFLSPLHHFTTTWPHPPDQNNPTVIAEAICDVIRTRPRWEETLISQFPSVDFTNPTILNELLKLQNNAFLSIRLFNWVNSQNGFSPDPLICKSLFDSLIQANASILAKSLIETVPQFNFDIGLLENLIKGLCNDGYVIEALDLFPKLKSLGVCPGLETWNCALLGAVRERRSDVVWGLYGEMMESGVTTDVETVGYLIQAFCMDDNVGRGYELLCQIRDGGNVPGNVALNKLVGELSKAGSFEEVSDVLHLMIGTDRKPNVYTYQGVIHGLCKRRKVVEAHRVFENLKMRGYAPNRVVYTTMIHGLCRENMLGKARKLWYEMMKKGMVPNEYTYNGLIHGYYKMGFIEEAWKLHKEMGDKGYEMNTLSYNILIAGLCRNGKVPEARKLFEEMTRNDIVPNTITYNALIGGLCRTRNLAKAHELFNELLAKGLEPSNSSYTPIIKLLCRVGKSKQALELCNDMANKGIQPSMLNHLCIIAGLCSEGLPIEGMKWLAGMLESKLRPPRMVFVNLIRCLLQQDKLDDAFIVMNSMVQFRYAFGRYLCSSLIRRFCNNNQNILDQFDVICRNQLSELHS